jgi:hypothetical protein
MEPVIYPQAKDLCLKLNTNHSDTIREFNFEIGTEFHIGTVRFVVYQYGKEVKKGSYEEIDKFFNMLEEAY